MPAADRTSPHGSALLHGANVPVRWAKEARILAASAVPTIFVVTVGARLVHACVAQAFVGRCASKEAQAAAGLAIAIYIPLTVPATGLVFTLGVLSAQAIGAGNVALAGEWLLVVTGAILLVGLCCSVACLVLTPVLVTLSTPDAKVRRMASEFSVVFVWSAILFQAFQMTRAWFQAQGVVMPFTLAAVFGIGCTAAFGALFACEREGLGWTGAALAVDLAGVGQLAAILLWSFCARGMHRAALAGADYHRAFTRLRALEVLRQGGYRALWLVIDEGAILAVTLMTGRLGTAEVAAQSIYFLLWSVVFAAQIGLEASISTRIGFYLGAGNARSAKRAMAIGFFAFAIKTVICNAAVLGLGSTLAWLFSSDPEVQALMLKNLMELTICITATALSQGTTAALDGAAAVRSLAGIVTVGSWLVSVPMSAWLGFGSPALRLRGVWLGMASGEVAKALAAGWVLARFDWSKAAASARHRAEVMEVATVQSGCSKKGDGEPDGAHQDGLRSEGELQSCSDWS